ncbi:bifunctional molybdenum cofactor biosynthesis protein MoaC/MoaB [Salinibacterium metalliresistens]|uniref:bifunctional molybdenum cofactor biosynthesis protein MoaC/MoaB n=1 Tax=Salinibacterium metalliresistens TaxID=3031321 RepID=UPI0030B80420
MSDTQPGAGLSHLDADGRARMVDVGGKAVTRRTAVATGTFTTTREVIALIRADDLPKADVLATARIAGIQGAKRTSELIPLCHPLPLSSVNVDFELGDDHVVITATARTTGQTGVEMEALTAVAVAGLTLHDMTKAVDPGSVLGDVRVTSKTGGKTRVPVRPDTAAVVVVSTSAAEGTRDDTTGPVIAAWLAERGYAVDAVEVVADADVAEALAAAVAAAPAVVITTGGTGMTPTDRTPEATRPLLTRELPGVAEAIRARGLQVTPTAALSRGLVGVAGNTIIVNLPGSPGGVKDGLAVLDELLEHLVAQLTGDGRH